MSLNVLFAQLLTQDFSSSTVVSDYVNATTPTNGQFTAIGSSSAMMVTSITGGALQYARTGGNGSFTRNADFSPVPDVMSFKFQLNVVSSSAAVAVAIIFNVGDEFTNTNPGPGNATIHSRFAIDLANGSFVFRDHAASMGVTGPNTYTINTNYAITFVINNSGSNGSYTAPNGATESISNDTWDLWIGTTKEFDDRAAITATQPLANIKMTFASGTATVQFDNFNVTSETTFLPVQLVRFDAKASNNSTLLSFSTATERNNAYFSIERSQDGTRFETIGKVTGAGTTTEKQNYTFTDERPLKGTNFYRLKQVDFDGQFSHSPMVSVNIGKVGGVRLSPQPVLDRLNVALEQPAVEAATWQVYDFAGRLLQSGTVQEESTNFEISTTTLTEGTYVLRLVSGQQIVTQQFQKN